MIKANIIIPLEYYNILTVFGSIEDVIYKALELCENGEIDLENLPQTANFVNTENKTVSVIITNSYYENLRNMYGATSPKVSLRKLLCYIVENEIYFDYHWEVVQVYDNETRNKINSYKYDITNKANKLVKLLKDEATKNKINEFIKLIDSL